MVKFAPVTKYKDADLPLPTRETKNAAGYDFVVAKDTVVPSYIEQMLNLKDIISSSNEEHIILDGDSYPTLTLDEIKSYTSSTKIKPTLVSTGMKCYLNPDTYLQLTVRSSTPLKHWLILANAQGIIDSDYADNLDNEGEIFMQLINLGPYPILLKKGDRIAQGIIHHYVKTDDDNAAGKRTGGFGSTDHQTWNPFTNSWETRSGQN